jgi:hypothetical protein
MRLRLATAQGTRFGARYRASAIGALTGINFRSAVGDRENPPEVDGHQLGRLPFWLLFINVESRCGSGGDIHRKTPRAGTIFQRRRPIAARRCHEIR